MLCVPVVGLRQYFHRKYSAIRNRLSFFLLFFFFFFLGGGGGGVGGKQRERPGGFVLDTVWGRVAMWMYV